MRITTLLMISLTPMLGLAGAARAQMDSLLARDPGCKQIATVQFLDCQVDQIYSCPKQAGLKGPYFRDEFFNDKGLNAVALSTADGWEFAELDPQGGFALLLDPSKAKATPLAEVMATGKGSYHGTGQFAAAQGNGAVTMDATVKVTGNKITLNGVELDEVEVRTVSDFPAPVGHSDSVSKAYLVPKLGYSVEGETISGTNFDPNATPHRPMSIALPGAPQFVTTKPAFCSSNMG